MTWEDDLFAVLEDLEQQADSAFGAERAPEVADRSRAEYQQVTLAARLMASLDRPVSLSVRGVGRIEGNLDRVCVGWCLLRGPGQDWLVRTTAIDGVEGASERAVPEVAWSPLTRIGFGSALRRLAEAGERCVLHGLDGSRHEGLPRRVGEDFVEVTVGQDRRQLLAFSGLAAVQSRD